MDRTTIQLAHGGGGWLSRELIRSELLTRFGDGPLRGLPDGATLAPAERPLVFTTDSFVVSPLEFPGGNIGHLAVHGTVNDLAVCGALPKWLSLALIIEEGLPLDVLGRILESVRSAAADAGVTVATGDTKVVGRGQCDRLYINTSGIGELLAGFAPGVEQVREGDGVLVSGPLGDHGMAVLACRESIALLDGPRSDTAPVHRLVQALGPVARAVRFMRDPTRGGLSAVLHEILEERPLDIVLQESCVPFSPGARAAAEILGLDLMHVASEGRVVLLCAADAAGAALQAWQALPEGAQAAIVGRVTAGRGRVVVETLAGGRRLLDLPRGELLPRIC